MAKLNWKSQKEIEEESKQTEKTIKEKKYLNEVLPVMLTTMRKLIREDELTIEEILGMSLIYEEWKPDMDIVEGKNYRYNGLLYKANKGHRSKMNWNPEREKTLFFEILPPDVIPYWEQRYGHNPYLVGDKVISSIDNKVYILEIPQWQGYEPPNQGWKLEE